ncbi:Rha family transcriptional regulator [Fusobacterium perfoetens]|uniref:Rha family transcriptional regulator n=1 Tax=Fusobacterium perfoetens TaxID=852 RepID=UPI001F408539|nr:Rha family transcriptional regulator [Fusobacterium perfoetens]MCF2611803.1 Rha family transcriptional regulator [Fusobacterium perfoetens]
MEMINVKVDEINGVLVTTSNRVAEELGVQHRSLVSKIDDYVKKFQSAKLSADFYIPSNYKDNRNRTYRNYLITKKGIAQLVGGYSSAVERAFELNVAYINKFDEMEKIIYQQEFSLNKELLSKIKKLENELEQVPMSWVQLELVKDQINETATRRMKTLNISDRSFKLKLKKEIKKDVFSRFGINDLLELKSKDYLSIMPYLLYWLEPYKLKAENITQLDIL